MREKNSMSAIAFIGLGNMGCPMAANLTKAGHSVRGFDLAPGARAAAAAAGVTIADSAREAVSTAEIVITMLPAGRHVLSAPTGRPTRHARNCLREGHTPW
jgi:3-hydroxyisobutyrate dehydrogenase